MAFKKSLLQYLYSKKVTSSYLTNKLKQGHWKLLFLTGKRKGGKTENLFTSLFFILLTGRAVL